MGDAPKLTGFPHLKSLNGPWLYSTFPENEPTGQESWKVTMFFLGESRIILLPYDITFYRTFCFP